MSKAVQHNTTLTAESFWVLQQSSHSNRFKSTRNISSKLSHKHC